MPLQQLRRPRNAGRPSTMKRNEQARYQTDPLIAVDALLLNRSLCSATFVGGLVRRSHTAQSPVSFRCLSRQLSRCSSRQGFRRDSANYVAGPCALLAVFGRESASVTRADSVRHQIQSTATALSSKRKGVLQSS